MAARSMMGLGRTGAAGTNGSGDYAIAFTTGKVARVMSGNQYQPRPVPLIANDGMSPLFLAVIEATEEAIYNSLFQARTTSGQGRTVEALPIKQTLEIMRKYRAL